MWEVFKRDSTTTAAVWLSIIISTIVFFICGNMFLVSAPFNPPSPPVS